MKLKRGDMFVVEGIGFISRLIKWRTGGVFSHSGLILDAEDDNNIITFESLTSIRRGKLSRYKGKRIFIVRPIFDSLTLSEPIKHIDWALNKIEEKWKGKTYPYWRLVFHILGWPFDKVSIVGWPVCSELDAYYESLLGLREEDDVWGTNPDDLGDNWLVSPKKFSIIKRGRL